MSIDYASAQTATRERYILGEGTAPLERAIVLPASHVQAITRGAAMHFHAVVTRLLRVAARALYLFPALVVVKIVLFVLGNPASDYITVGFVVLVVVFFTLFSVTLLSHAIVGSRSERKARAKLAFAPPRVSDFERVVEKMLPDARTRFVGRVQAGLAPGEPVLVDEWSHGEQLARFVEGRSFAVIPEKEGDSPCIVEIAAAPVLVAEYADSEDGAALTVAGVLAERAPAARSRCVLRQGERVAIVARSSQPSTSVEDGRLLALIAKDGPADPYRAAEPSGIVVRSTPEAPVVIQLLGNERAI